MNVCLIGFGSVVDAISDEDAERYKQLVASNQGSRTCFGAVPD